MVNYFIYAKDYSGSTNGQEYYHENGLKTLQEFKRDVNQFKSEITDGSESRIIYLHWDNECVEVDEETTIGKYENQCGYGGTSPETIIEWIKAKTCYDIKLLYIITDGQIDSSSVYRCNELNKHVNYENVVFHAFNKCLETIDLSVAASFMKGRCTIHRNYELLDDTDVSKDFEYDRITIDNFATEKKELKSYIQFKYINIFSENNAVALVEIENLKKLRNRLFNELSYRKEIKTNLDTIRDRDTFICEFKNTNWYKNLKNLTVNIKIDIEQSISTLINYIISKKKSYAFDALKFETTFRNEVPEETIIDLNFTADQEIEFPDIILDDEKGIPVILITELDLLDKIIFKNSVSTASFTKFKSSMDCPLFLLTDPEFNDSIGYFYTINVYKQLLEQTTKTEPRTRRPYHGGLVLVDTDDFDKYNDYILSATYFNSKKVKYNVGLFYYVLWKICQNKEWMDKNVVQQFEKYMLRRVSTTVCKIGLLSLPLDPQMKTLLPTALWYCVEISSYIFKDDPQHFTHERLRMYYGVAYAMIEILKNLGYDLNIKAIDKRRDLIRNVMILKRIPKQVDKVNYLLDKAFKTVNGFLVCEFEEADVKKLNYLKLNHKEMLNDDIIKEEVFFSDYIHCLHHVDNSEVQLCDKTYRPFFVVDEDRSFYSELFKNAKRTVINDLGGQMTVTYEALDELEFSKILSYYNLYLNYVQKHKKYPSLEEYTEYILKKKKFKEDLVTIFPVNVHKEIERVFTSYESLVKDVSAKEFVALSNKYVDRVERIKAENKRAFETDKHINDYILEEERKVNLIKVVEKVKQPKVYTEIPVQKVNLEKQAKKVFYARLHRTRFRRPTFRRPRFFRQDSIESIWDSWSDDEMNNFISEAERQIDFSMTFKVVKQNRKPKVVLPVQRVNVEKQEKKEFHKRRRLPRRRNKV